MRILLTMVFCIISCTTFANIHNTIYVYSDHGVSSESLTHTLHTLHGLFDSKYSIKKLKAQDVMRGDWRKNAALFIMPGGADLPYVKALNGKGNQQIRDYVERGGKYLGICAGGYYASREVQFAVGTPLEVVGPRELAFFPGVAKGPALAPYYYHSNRGARAARIKISNDKLQHATVFFNGGGEFIPDQNQKNFDVIARYEDLPQHPAAIVKIKIGSGTAILTGVHFEYDPALLDSSDAYLSPIISALNKHQRERMELLKKIFGDGIGILTS
ncbi:MAG: biofilm PGA synthesis protein PgaB [Gammaproteobacteria bacterium]|nr:biofilm PGA synthesis protein PgaB [Gammaproteobacteria bacterium]